LGAGAIRKENIPFRKGLSEATIKGRLQGDQAVDYRVHANAGQTLVVALQKSNPQNHFNVLPPGSTDVAMFVGGRPLHRVGGVRVILRSAPPLPFTVMHL